MTKLMSPANPQLAWLTLLLSVATATLAQADSGIPSPDGSVQFKFFLNEGKLSYSISRRIQAIILVCNMLL